MPTVAPPPSAASAAVLSPHTPTVFPFHGETSPSLYQTTSSYLNHYIQGQGNEWFKWPSRLSLSPRPSSGSTSSNTTRSVSPASTMATSTASISPPPGIPEASSARRDSDGSCNEAIVSEEVPTQEVSMLEKMEQLNKSNEEDARSVASRKSGGSSGGSAPKREASVAAEEEEEDLWTVWGDLIRNWETEIRKRPAYIKTLVKRGIPQHFRTIAWQLLSNASVSAIHETYSDYMRQSSVYEKVIQRDIPRTYPELEFFKDAGRGQSSLFNVIKAYSIHDKEVGYCQGSAFIVGQLLLQMPEEEAFAVLVRLMENYRLRELYKPTMTDLGLCMFQLECVVQEQMPDLFTHFNNMGFDTSMYASSWFLTLFTTTLPLEIANRIMDCFLVEGMEYIFCIAMAILQQARIDLLRLDMEGMLKYFQREIRERYEHDAELLFTVASMVTLNPKRMKKLEKDYLAKRTKEQEEAVELRRLRTENRLLRQRIDYLEAESSALADRLVKGQVNLAQEAENCISISHELNILRDINSEAHKKLEDAYESIRELSSKRQANMVESEAQVDDTSMIEHIHSLQQELMERVNKQADAENIIRDLKQRIHELELSNKRLREHEPEEGIAGLQEELISVKMREAEAALSLKEIRQRLAELEQQWAKYIHMRTFDPSATPSSDSAPSSPTGESATTPGTEKPPQFTATIMGGGGEGENTGVSIRELEDQLMGVRIKEADTLAELKEMRQKVMELETQNRVCSNQLKRQDEELKRLKEEKEVILKSARDSDESFSKERSKFVARESELTEQNMMQRIKYSEAVQSIQDLRQQMNNLELKSAEKWTEGQLRGASVCDDDDGTSLNELSMAGSHHSVGSASIASEDMRTLLSEMSLKVPSDSLCSRVVDPLSEEEDEGTETEDSRRKMMIANEEDGNDTTDSGIKC
ncbi:eat-17 [Pristionchus pacificus]|uniref:Eat-17 n=1 Tax=Pristionchus pacificus TaxID=54126 RepID=A0A2A6CZQ9_PRIPA|nr:eat-17 [Pristionchus pacificus]|eukprot:PDM83618.1 eat-17 [Pristionchus pacificus]